MSLIDLIIEHELNENIERCRYMIQCGRGHETEQIIKRKGEHVSYQMLYDILCQLQDEHKRKQKE